MMSSVFFSNKIVWIILVLAVIASSCSHWMRKEEPPLPKIYDRRAVELFIEATIAEELQDYYRAVVLYQEALRRDSTSVTIHLALAGLHQHLRQYESTLLHLNAAWRLDPEDPGITEWIVELLGDLERWGDQKPYVERLLKLDPDNLTYNLQMGNVYLQTGDRKAARKRFRRVINLADDHKDTLLRLGAVFMLNNETELAESCYRKAIEVDPADNHVHYALGRLYASIDRERDARKQLEMAIAIADTIVDYWASLAALDLDSDRYVQAEETLRRALEIIPDHPVLLNLLGSSLERQDRNDEALEVLFRSAFIDSLSVAPYITIGFVYDETDQFELAESTYKKALEIEPGHPTLLNNYAYLLAVRGIRLEEAMEMANQAVEQAPDNASYLDTKGWVYFKMGDHKRALEWLLKSLEYSDEEGVELLDHIGDVYWELKEYQEAHRYWKRALDVEPDNEKLREKLERPL
jgi:tetratricopeptide (TPR) repeat protein